MTRRHIIDLAAQCALETRSPTRDAIRRFLRQLHEEASDTVIDLIQAYIADYFV